MGLLSMYNSGSTVFTSTIHDYSTQYPPTNTGTPTLLANPGASPVPFTQPYSVGNTYLNQNSNYGGPNTLKDSPKITNLDVEDPGVQGGIPYKQLNDPTVYPTDVNHTSPIRGWFASPSSPPDKYNQVFTPQNTYMDYIESDT